MKYSERIAQREQPLYDERTEWDKLINVLQVQLDGSQDPLQRVQVQREIARLREEFQQDKSAAFDAYCGRRWRRLFVRLRSFQPKDAG